MDEWFSSPFKCPYKSIMHLNTVILQPPASCLSYSNMNQSLKERSTRLPVDDGNSAALHQTLESYMEESVPPSENYPVNNTGLHGGHGTFAYDHGSLSVEQKKEFFEVTRNSLEVLSSMLNTETEPKPTKVIPLLA